MTSLLSAHWEQPLASGKKTRQWNVGTTWAGRMGRVADYVSLSVDGYYNEVDDKIVAVPTMFVWKMSNVGKWRRMAWMSTLLRNGLWRKPGIWG